MKNSTKKRTAILLVAMIMVFTVASYAVAEEHILTPSAYCQAVSRDPDLSVNEKGDMVVFPDAGGGGVAVATCGVPSYIVHNRCGSKAIDIYVYNDERVNEEPIIGRFSMVDPTNGSSYYGPTKWTGDTGYATMSWTSAELTEWNDPKYANWNRSIIAYLGAYDKLMAASISTSR